MGERGTFTLKGLSDKIFGILLTVVLMSAGIYVYIKSYVNIYSVSAAVLAVVIFIFLSFVQKKKGLGVVIYIVSLILIFNMLNFILNMLPGIRVVNIMSFAEWFFSAGEAVETNSYYMAFFILGFTFFISSAIYYFTAVVYRPLLVVLISFIPCILFVRTMTAFPLGYLLIIASLNLFIYLKGCRDEIGKDAVSVNQKAVFICYTDFAVAAVLLAFIIPKPTETPYYEQFAEFTSRYFTIGRAYAGAEGRFTRYSGNADQLLQEEERTLYMVSAEVPESFKMQTFYSFDEENYRWGILDEAVTGDADWEDERARLNMGDLLEAYKRAFEISPDTIGAYISDELLSLGEVRERRQFSQVRAMDYRSEYIVAPVRVIEVSFPESSRVSRVYRAGGGELFPDTELMHPFEVYTLVYYSGRFIYESGWLEAGGCNYSFEEFGNMLAAVEAALKSGGVNSRLNTVSAFLKEHNEAKLSRAENYQPVPESLKELALEITAPYEYDWQKAAALEAFFHKGDFTYDLTFTSERNNNSAEFFTFESKRGTCSDFATAFSLMARGAGLTVRYAEGYNLTRRENSESYMITTETAHAYPEVYIPGAGWVTFEPTVADLTGRANGGNVNIDAVTALATIVSTLIVGLFIITFFLLKPILTEAAFRFKIRLAKGGKAAIMLHARHSAQISKLFSIDTKPLTAEQTFHHAKELTGEASSPLLSAFTKACYGDEEIGDNEKVAAFDCYKAQYKLLKQRRKGK
ncbi:MAG: transglutaminase-like domain-containing protein [Oscillospiraceae bacterium]|nr:transglutaminase-like domain-containing protein [Oscillospiraceae bacterium]